MLDAKYLYGASHARYIDRRMSLIDFISSLRCKDVQHSDLINFSRTFTRYREYCSHDPLSAEEEQAFKSPDCTRGKDWAASRAKTGSDLSDSDAALGSPVLRVYPRLILYFWSPSFFATC